jgi:tRNA nucleotidyltransferase (CCA-adding enzyme)
MKQTLDMPPVFEVLGGIFHKKGIPLYAVGGFVRNSLLHLPLTDFDICSAMLPEEAAAFMRLEGAHVIEKALDFGTIEIHYLFEGKKHVFEHTTLRKDFYGEGGSHRPLRVVFTDDLALDAVRRDFTINAIYADALSGEVIDITGRGLPHLLEGVIAAAHDDPHQTLQDDGLRLLRLVRFACELGFSIDPALWRAACEKSSLLKDISAERIRDELVKIMLSDTKYPQRTQGAYPHKNGLLMLKNLGALEMILPSLLQGVGVGQNTQYHVYDVFSHSIQAFAVSPPDLQSRLAALLHDTAKPLAFSSQGNMYGHERYGAEIARDELKALAFDNKTIDTVSLLIKNHMFDLQNKAKPLTVRKKAAELGIALFEKLIALRRSDFIGSGKPLETVESADKWQAVLAEMIEEKTPFLEKDLKITGTDIMKALGIAEGTLVGEIKKRLLALCIARPSQNTQKSLLRHAKNIYKDIASRK